MNVEFPALSGNRSNYIGIVLVLLSLWWLFNADNFMSIFLFASVGTFDMPLGLNYVYNTRVKLLASYARLKFKLQQSNSRVQFIKDNGLHFDSQTALVNFYANCGAVLWILAKEIYDHLPSK